MHNQQEYENKAKSVADWWTNELKIYRSSFNDNGTSSIEDFKACAEKR